MVINMEILWQHWMMTIVAGLAILVTVVSGFAVVGFLCGCITEFITRKEAAERRNKEVTAARMSPQPEEAPIRSAFRVTGGLEVVADVQRATSLTTPGHRR